MTINEIESYAKHLMSEKRFKHTRGVAQTAKELAEIHGTDTCQAVIAALLHDVAKEMPASQKREFCQKHNIGLDQYLDNNIALSHGYIAAKMAEKQCNIQDEDILNAISYHTLGRCNMSQLEKIIYLADMVEPGRKPYPGLDQLRQLTYCDLDHAMKFALTRNIRYLKAKNKTVHPIIYCILEEYNKEMEE